MRLFPTELEVGDYEGFTPDKDIFSRKQFGEGMGNLFANVEDPMVAILDAPWGSGKTTFIRMWCGHMRNRGFPVIYFDAFKNDYTEDAFLALAGEVIALADDLGSIDAETRKNFLKKAKQIAWAAAKGGLKKGLSKCFGEDGAQEIGAAIVEDGADCLLGLSDAYIQEKLEGRKKERDAFIAFGHALEVLSTELSKAIQTKTVSTKADESPEGTPQDIQQRPLIFVIDELDRCKPPFALALLEKVKHFFSVPQVHFLLVTHMKQLEDSVHYTYGMGRRSALYLQKFYHVVLMFPENEINPSKTSTRKYLDKLFSTLPDDTQGGQYANELKNIIAKYAEQQKTTFRSLERITTQAGIVLATTNRKTQSLIPLVATLCIMKATAPSLYKLAQSKKLTLRSVCDFTSFNESDHYDSFHKELWEFCIGDEKHYAENKERLSKHSSLTYLITSRERSDIIPSLCGTIDSLKFESIG